MFGEGVQLHSQADVNHCKCPKLYWNTMSGKLLYKVMPVFLFPHACARVSFTTGVTQGLRLWAGELMGAGRYW